MVEIDLFNLNVVLTKGVRCLVFVRKLAQEIGRDHEHLARMEAEFREAAGEVQKAQDAVSHGEEVAVRDG